MGVEIRYYDLLPDKGWEANLDTVKSLIDRKTKAILVTNPSNPCSTVFSKEHQLEIIKIAETYKVPLLCDEVYYGLVFPGQEFHSFANLSSTVPMICLNSLSKVYMVPGWRLGWIIVYNRHGYFDKVKDHLAKYQRIPYHPCSLIMYALPKIFKETPKSFIDDYRSKLAVASDYVFEGLSKIKGIQPIKATASMYMMVRIYFDQFKPDAGFTDDKVFVLRLWEEESVLILPSQCFYESGFVRIVTCISIESADDFLKRFNSFISRYLI